MGASFSFRLDLSTRWGSSDFQSNTCLLRLSSTMPTGGLLTFYESRTLIVALPELRDIVRSLSAGPEIRMRSEW